MKKSVNFIQAIATEIEYILNDFFMLNNFSFKKNSILAKFFYQLMIFTEYK